MIPKFLSSLIKFFKPVNKYLAYTHSMQNTFLGKKEKTPWSNRYFKEKFKH